MKTIIWCRQDLRLFDNPALHAAAKDKDAQILPVFIYPEGMGDASYWWLHNSLSRFAHALEERGVRLILRTGKPEDVLLEIAQQLNADKVVWNRDYSPLGMSQGQELKQVLDNAEVASQSFNGQLLIEPTKVLTQQGTPFKVFTPFWRYCRANVKAITQVVEPLDVPELQSIDHDLQSDTLEEWDLLPTSPDWSEGLGSRWQPGEDGAQKRWREFLEGPIDQYKEGRDFPSQKSTSYLSPHLAFGEISPRQLSYELQQSLAANEIDSTNADKFFAELGWREYSRYLLVHFPKITEQSFNLKFEEFPWQNSPKLLKDWQKGQTGYPIVDAGMRELWETGYMHNRVRMIVASFLTKHCLVDWRKGMDWFWDTLVDADIANNTASWQWVAGCGADASPYFRIFNPILQGDKFDKEGVYIRKWVPELKFLPNKYLNKPWEASAEILSMAKVKLGDDYPFPVVDHREARAEALDAYKSLKKTT